MAMGHGTSRPSPATVGISLPASSAEAKRNPAYLGRAYAMHLAVGVASVGDVLVVRESSYCRHSSVITDKTRTCILRDVTAGVCLAPPCAPNASCETVQVDDTPDDTQRHSTPRVDCSWAPGWSPVHPERAELVTARNTVALSIAASVCYSQGGNGLGGCGFQTTARRT
jgi:hypothetical protein